jgi:hypothetical protein
MTDDTDRRQYVRGPGRGSRVGTATDTATNDDESIVEPCPECRQRFRPCRCDAAPMPDELRDLRDRLRQRAGR